MMSHGDGSISLATTNYGAVELKPGVTLNADPVPMASWVMTEVLVTSVTNGYVCLADPATGEHFLELSFQETIQAIQGGMLWPKTT